MAFNKVGMSRQEFSGLMLERTHSVGALNGLEFFLLQAESMPAQNLRIQTAFGGLVE